MASFLHLTNAKGRDATVGVKTVPSPTGPTLGVPGLTLIFRRYLAATESGIHQALTAQYGPDYGQALIEADPEIDYERVGQFIEQTVPVYLDGDGRVVQVCLFEQDGDWQGWLYREGHEQTDWFTTTNRATPWQAAVWVREREDTPKPPELIIASTSDHRRLQATLPRLKSWGNDVAELGLQFEHLKFYRRAGLRFDVQAEVEDADTGEVAVGTLLFEDVDGVARLIPTDAIDRIERPAMRDVNAAAGRLWLTAGEKSVPIWAGAGARTPADAGTVLRLQIDGREIAYPVRSEEHTSELQSH